MSLLDPELGCAERNEAFRFLLALSPLLALHSAMLDPGRCRDI